MTIQCACVCLLWLAMHSYENHVGFRLAFQGNLDGKGVFFSLGRLLFFPPQDPRRQRESWHCSYDITQVPTSLCRSTRFHLKLWQPYYATEQVDSYITLHNVRYRYMYRLATAVMSRLIIS